MSNLIQLEAIEASMFPELQGWKEKQEAIVKDNPFVSIVDNKTYEEAKKARTALVSARTTIEKQDKLIASKLKDLRSKVGDFSLQLIEVTRPHEEKQQDEVKRFEAEKEAERQAKEKAEADRKATIQATISSLIESAKGKIDLLTFETIDVLKVDFEKNLYLTDATQFEEFEMEFASKLQVLKNSFLEKCEVLEDKENQRLERERLQKEKEEFEAERKAKEEADRAEREKRDAEQRKIDEANRKRQQELDAKEKALKDEEDKRKKQEEAEIKAKEEAERKSKEETEKAEREKAEILRLEALKPDKEKALAYLDSLVFVSDFPVLKNDVIHNELELIINSLDVYKQELKTKISLIK